MAEDTPLPDESLFVDSPPPAQDDSLFLESPPGDDPLFIDSPAADSPAPSKPEDDPWDLTRGFMVAMQQIPQLGYGVAGLIGDTVGLDSLRDWGLDGYREASEKQMPLQRENDDVTKAWEKAKTGDIGALADWAQYGLGYALGQAAESAAVAVGGAAIGAMAGAPAGGVGAVPGAAGGATAGIVAKQGVKTAAKNLVESFVAKQALKLAAEKLGKKATAAEVATLAADSVVRKSAAKRLGAMVAVGGNALGMELGSIYPEAVAQAREEGRDFTGADLAKVWGTGIAAGALEGVTDMLGLDLVTGKLRKMLPSSRTAAATIAGLAGIAAEGTTEFAQTGLERLGAGKDLAGPEALNEYINATALGALGGGVIGGGGGFVSSHMDLRRAGMNQTADAVLEAMDFALTQQAKRLPVISAEGARVFADRERAALQAIAIPDEAQAARLASLEVLYGEDGSFDAQKAATLFDSRLDQTPAEAAPSAPQATPEAKESKPHAFSIGAATFEAPSDSPAAMLEAAFGPAPAGQEYNDETDMSAFATDKDGNLSHGGIPLNRRIGPDGVMSKLPRDRKLARPDPVSQFSKPIKKEDAEGQMLTPAAEPEGGTPKDASPPTPPVSINLGDVELELTDSEDGFAEYQAKDANGTVAKFTYMRDRNGIWRPAPGTRLTIAPRARGKGIARRFIKAFADAVGAVGSTGLSKEENTSEDAQKMWRALEADGASVEEQENDTLIGQKKSWVIRGDSQKPSPTPPAKNIGDARRVGEKIMESMPDGRYRMTLPDGTEGVAIKSDNRGFVTKVGENAGSVDASVLVPFEYTHLDGRTEVIQPRRFELMSEAESSPGVPSPTSGAQNGLDFAGAMGVGPDGVTRSLAKSMVSRMKEGKYPDAAGKNPLGDKIFDANKAGDLTEDDAVEIIKSHYSPSPTPVVASTKPAATKRTRDDVEREISAIIDEDTEAGGDATSETIQRELAPLRRELKAMDEAPALQAPDTGGAPAVRSEARISDVEAKDHISSDNTVTGDSTPLGALEVGMPVVTRDVRGKMLTTRIVLSTVVNEKGERVHTLSPQVSNDEAFNQEAFKSARIPPTTRESKAALDIASSLLTGTNDGPSVAATEKLLRAVLERVTGKAFADAMFATTTDNLTAQFHKNRIFVNPAKWAELLRSRLDGLSATSREAEMIAEDWISEMELNMWHEARHKYLVDELGKNPEIVRAAMQALVDNARSNPQAAAALGQVARGRYMHAANFEAKLANITDAQVLDLLAGKPVNGMVLSPQQLADEIFALGAEFDALFIQNLHSGMDPAAIREAVNRFATYLAGNPTKTEAGALKNLLERLTELLRRGIEASARFMRAHRLARTLPEEFLNLSLALDQVMKGDGIVAPDPTRVVERFSRRASERMANVAKVEEILKSREWFDGNERVTEFEVKEGVRNLIRLATEKDPKFKPVFFNRATGLITAHRKLAGVIGADQAKKMDDLLARLNDPRRSAMALEAEQIARDTRLVLKNLNYGIPTTARPSADPTWDGDMLGSGDFTRAAAILNENLETEVEQRTGFNTADLLEQINRTLVNLPAPVPPTGLMAVRDAMRGMGHGPYDALEREWEALDKQAAEIEAAVLEATPEKKQELLARAGALREAQLGKRYQQDLLRNHIENYKSDPTRKGWSREEEDRMVFRRDQLRAARVTQIRAEIQHAEAQTLFQNRAAKLRDFGDLANQGYSVGMLQSLLSALPGLDVQQLHAILGRASEVRRAFARLSLLPAELEFMLLGGPKPESMRSGPRETSWVPLGDLDITSSGARDLLPTNAPALMWRWSNEEGLFEPDAVSLELGIDSPAVGRVVFNTGADFAELPLERQAAAINNAVGASARLAGYELTEKKALTAQGENIISATYRRNMSAIARDLAHKMRRAMILGDEFITSSALLRGGFPEINSINEEGDVSGALSETLMPVEGMLPFRFKEDGSSDFEAGMEDLFDKGYAARHLLSAAGFMDRMGGRDVFSRAVPHYSEGYTPAGLAHAVLTPRFLKFLALTKGSEHQKRMRASLPDETTRKQFDAIYEALAPGLEKTREMAPHRDAASMTRAFYQMREGMIMGDILYKDSIHEAAGLVRRGYDPEKIGVADETRSPLDEELLHDFTSFQQPQIARTAQSKQLLGAATEQSEVAITLLRYTPSAESLRMLDSLEDEQQKVVLVRGEITEGDFTPSDMRMMLESDDQRTNTDLTPESDQMTNAGKDWLMDNLRRHEERLMQREERVITQLMLSLYAGSEQAVRRVINSFAYTVNVGGSEAEGSFEVGGEQKFGKFTQGALPTKHWNRGQIRKFLRERLEEMRRDEAARGVIRSDQANGDRNTVFDDVFNTTEERQGLIDRHQEHAGILRHVMATGGTLYSGTAPSAFAVEAFDTEDGKLTDRYDADATSVLYALLGKIGNISILSGHASWGMLYGDEESRIPSMAFIPDKEHPMLVLPYGKIQPTTEEAVLAIEGALEWLGNHGGVNFADIVRPIIGQLTMVNETGLGGIIAGYGKALNAHLDITQTPFASQQERDERVSMWIKGVTQRIQEIKAKGFEELSDVLNPDVLQAVKDIRIAKGSPKQVDQEIAQHAAYRKVLARLLTSPAAKELLIYTTFNQSATQPSAQDLATFGDIIGFHSVRGLDMQAMRDQMLVHGAQGLAVVDDRGMAAFTLRQNEDGDGVSGEIKSFGDLVVEQESETTLPPIVPLQAEWANAVLYDAIRSITPQRDPSIPMEGQQRAAGLSQYQARQLLSVLDVRIDGSPATVDQIVNADGAFAAEVQRRFTRWANTGTVPGSKNDEMAALEQVRRYGTYSFIDPLIGRGRRWENNRVQKGAVLFAELAGVEFKESPGGSRHATTQPDLKAWEAAFAKQNILKDMLTTLDAAGRPLAGKPERVSVFEGMRRAVFGEAAASREYINAQEKRAQAAFDQHRNLQESLEATKQLLDDQYESLDAMLSWLDDGTTTSALAADTIRSFIASREQVAADLARDVVFRFENFNTGSAVAGDPFSPSASSVINEDNPLVFALTDIKHRYHGQYRGVETGLSDNNTLTAESLRPGSRYADHNRILSALFFDLLALSPANFSRGERESMRLTEGMASGEAQQRIHRLNGLINRLDDPAWLKQRLGSRHARRSAFGGVSDQVKFSSEVEQAVVNALYENGFRAGESLDKASRERLANAIVPIISKELYGDVSHMDELKSDIRAKLAELEQSAVTGELQHARDVYRILTAAGRRPSTNTSMFPDERQEFSSRLVNPLVRNRALAEILHGRLSELSGESEDTMRWEIEKLEKEMEQKVEWAGWRVGGFASLRLETGDKANATDVEIAKRVLDAYGLMWSRLYMRNYGKSDFAVGIAVSEQATEAADMAAREGFGSMMGIAPGERFRLVDGILEPENALERIAGVLRARGNRPDGTRVSSLPSVTPFEVLARLRRDARKLADLTENGPWPGQPKLKPGGDLSKGPAVILAGSEESLESMIERIRLGDYSKKEVKSFIDQALASTKDQIALLQKQLPSPKEYQDFLTSVTSRKAQDKLDAISAKRVEVKSLQRRIRTLNQRMAEYEAGLLVENEADGVALFSPVEAPESVSERETRWAAEARAVLARFNIVTANAASRNPALHGLKPASQSAVFKGDDPAKVTRDQLTEWLAASKRILHSKELVGIEPTDEGDLHARLDFALSSITADPNSEGNLRRFHEMSTKAIAAAWSKGRAELWATGYLHTKRHVEETWFYRNMLHVSSKVAGIFAADSRAIQSANEVRSILDNGTDGNGGKNRYSTGSDQVRKAVAEYLDKVDKKSRYLTASRGLLLAQISSHLAAHGKSVHAAKGLLGILNAAETGLARANLNSAGGAPARTMLGKVARKGRQFWNMLHERGYRQIDNQGVMLDMFSDVIPMLELAIENDSETEVLGVVSKLRGLWGKQSSGYSDLLMGLFQEHRSGLENVLALRGEDMASYANKPLIPFIWSNVTSESYTTSDIKSMGNLLDPSRSAWNSSSFRAWESDEQYDLLDFDGVTAPLRMMNDMLYRTMMAPAYDAVSAIVGDVSVSSDHFSQYANDEKGQPKSGYIVEMADRLRQQKLMSHHDYMKARSGALAMGNMVRDELVNDMTGFSASSRAIEAYRKIAITGLARKLFSLSQPIAQTLSPMAGYLAANGARGIRFVPIQMRYLAGKMPFASAEARQFTEGVDRIVESQAPAVAHRAADSNQMIQETMQDARLSGGDVHRSAFLGRADGAVRPLLGLAGKSVDLMAKGSAKALEWLIAKPESSMIRPLLVHEILEEFNQGQSVPFTIDQLLAGGDRIRPRHVQAATVRVEQLFGTAKREQKGKLSQPSKSMGDEVARSLLTTLAGHPISMAANSWAASRMMIHNRAGSPEFREGARILGMTIGQNMTFVFVTAPTLTFIASTILASLFDWDEDERQEWEGALYGIDVDEAPEERRKKLSYWAMSLLGRSEDPYGYSWHQNEFTDEQQAKHDGYRYARIVKELINQAPVIGSLSSTTLGGSLIDAGLKASDISPQSAVKQAGIILPEKWGFTGTAAEPDEDTPFSERSIYLATKFWFNYLNDSNSAAFAVDPLFQSLKYAANNTEDLDAVDAFMIGATLVAPKPREIDRAIQRQYPALNPDFEALAPWEAH